MRVVVLQYHDVIAGSDFGASGFPGADSDSYKMTRTRFAEHVASVSAAVKPNADPLSALAPASRDSRGDRRGTPVVFTFDDGGVSAYATTADILESAGWRGIFLMTTDWISTPGFLDDSQLRDLRSRGHVIGAHSCSHPIRFARCTAAQMRAEWRGSVARLQDVLGEPVNVASVPGGYFSRAVAVAAAEAGIRTLFTSEPTTAVDTVDGCRVIGRFTLRSESLPSTAASIAANRIAPRAKQWISWNTRKAAKAIAGDTYLQARRLLLERSASRPR